MATNEQPTKEQRCYCGRYEIGSREGHRQDTCWPDVVGSTAGAHAQPSSKPRLHTCRGCGREVPFGKFSTRDSAIWCTNCFTPEQPASKPMFDRLRDNASQGVDLSPGDPVAAWAVGEIERLQSRISELELDVCEDERQRAALDGLCAWLLHRFGPDSPEGREASVRLAPETTAANEVQK